MSRPNLRLVVNNSLFQKTKPCGKLTLVSSNEHIQKKIQKKSDLTLLELQLTDQEIKLFRTILNSSRTKESISLQLKFANAILDSEIELMNAEANEDFWESFS